MRDIGKLQGGEGEGLKSVIGRDTIKSLLTFAKKIDRNWVRFFSQIS